MSDRKRHKEKGGRAGQAGGHILGIALVLAGVVAFFIMLRTEPAGSIGSFEYVRKGAALFHDGKIAESIPYFEKAYEASPDNAEIKTNLSYAYSKYAEKFSEKKDYMKALVYLKKACDVNPSPDEIRNLAVMYSKHAVSRAASEGLDAAMGDFTMAREVASFSDDALSGLSVSLYNDAVGEFNAGREGMAVILLKESSLAEENARTFELLGDIYYRGTSLGKARFYYGKALSIDQQNPGLKAKLQKVEKEIEIDSRNETVRLGHFEIRHARDMEFNEALAGSVLERCYADVGKELGYYPSDKTAIFLYSEKNFRRIFKTSASVRAFYDGNIRMPMPAAALGDEEFAHYIYHEYTHAAVSAKTENNCPVWLSEGIAMWMEYRNYEAAFPGRLDADVNRPLITLDLLDSAFRIHRNNISELKKYYILSYSAVKFMIQEWGIEALRRLLADIRLGRHAVNAIEDVYLVSQKEFEKRWHRYMEKNEIK